MTIAGSDSCGGAGIQADIKTITCNKVYAMSAITALTAQNTTGVFGIMEVEPEFLQKQIDAVVTDIFPDSVKVGMVSSAALIKIVAFSFHCFSCLFYRDLTGSSPGFSSSRARIEGRSR